MAWVRLEDTFPEHPKVAAVGGDAAWLHVCGIAYCNRNLTDGFIPRGALGQLSDRRSPRKLAQKLVDVAIWHDDPERDGYVIHDYLEYNPTRVEVEAERAKKHEVKARAGQLGGVASGIARRKHKGSTPEANGEAERKQNEAPTRPDPTLATQVEDNKTLLTGGDASSRINAVVDAYARMETARAKDAGRIKTNEDGYHTKARDTALKHPELERLIDLFPTAPPDVIASALRGEKHSLSYYPRSDELRPNLTVIEGEAS